jgi:hypothetical protein
MGDSVGSVFYGTTGAGGGGGVAIAGARNGVSIDSAGFIVLGQEPVGVGGPAIFLDTRSENMGGFNIDWFNGQVIVSDTATGLVGTAILQVMMENDAAQPIALFQDSSGGSSTLGVVINGIQPTGNIVSPPLFQVQRSGKPIWIIDAGGIVSFVDTRDGAGSVGNASFGPTVYIGRQLENGKTICLNITSEWEPVSTPGFANALSDIAVFSNVLFNTADGYDYAAIRVNGNVNQSGGSTTIIRGFYYEPNIVAVTSPIVAFENTIGNVLLCTQTGSPHIGSVSVRLGSAATLPTAHLHIGPGAAAAGNGPLKLTAGTLLTVPEDGTIEYDGTNFYKTIGATRTVIL